MKLMRKNRSLPSPIIQKLQRLQRNREQEVAKKEEDRASSVWVKIGLLDRKF